MGQKNLKIANPYLEGIHTHTHKHTHMVSLPWALTNSTNRSEDSEEVMCLLYVVPADGIQAIGLEVNVFTH